MYTETNYKSKKAIKEDLAAGKKIRVFQPNAMGPTQTDGRITIEGPHYPMAHKFYAEAVIKDGCIVSIK